MEHFLKINYYSNYSVSNYGDVRNDLNGIILKPGYRGDYFQVVLTKTNGDRKTFSIHKLVATAFLTNPENKPFVDHIDGNPKNNHVTNLRFATVSENSMNSKISTQNTSGTKGISWVKQSKRWRVTIMVNNKTKHIDSFDKLDDAIIARKKAEDKYFGEFQRFKNPFEKAKYEYDKLIKEFDFLLKEINDMTMIK